MKKFDDIDSWFFKNLVKGIIDALIVLLNLLRPKDDKPTPDIPYVPKPNPILPDRPWFPWLRRQIDTIISVNNNKTAKRKKK